MSTQTLEENEVQKPMDTQPKGQPKDLFAKFKSVGLPPMPSVTGEDVTTEPPEQEEQIPAPEQNPTPEQKNQELDIRKPKTPFVKKTIQQAQEAEERARKAEEALKRYLEQEKPALESKLKELEEKIQSADTQKEFEKYQKQIAELEQLKEQRDRENEEMRAQLSLYDLTKDPEFQKKYVQPLVQDYQQIRYILGGDQDKIAELDKALFANQAALNATDESEALRQQKIRDEILNNIYEELQPIQQAQFNQAAYSLLSKSIEQHKAIKNHNQTREELERLRKEAEIAARTKWKKTYQEIGKEIETEYPDNIKKIIREKNIDDDTSYDDMLAQSIVEDGGTKYVPEEIVRIIHQGRQYKKLHAHIAALNALLEEQKETINTLRGSTSTGSDAPIAPQKKKEEKTPQGLFEKYRFKPMG